jgi:hypothetical protein
LFLVDLHAVQLGGPLDWPTSRDNLVILNRWFVLRVSRTDRLRFWKAYCAERGARNAERGAALTCALGGRHSAVDLERRTWASNVSFWGNRDRRCLVTNRRFERVRGFAVSGHVVRELDRVAVADLLADPDEPFRRAGVKLLKDSRSSTVAELQIPVNGALREVIYKRFRVTLWSDPLAALVRDTPALRSWIYGHSLLERCLPTARPLAVLHRRRHGLVYEGYLLTEKIASAEHLRAYLDRLNRLTDAHRRTALRHRIDQVAVLARELHRRHLSHRDLKASNLLVDKDQVWLIDLVGVRHHRKLGRGRRVQNLARLHASFHDNPTLTRTDKVRFLRAYLQWGLLGKGGWKNWWNEIEQATWIKVARNRKNGRPLA